MPSIRLLVLHAVPDRLDQCRLSLTPGALARVVAALDTHPQWLMLYREGEEFNSSTGLRQRYPTQPPAAGIEAFRSHCFICQPTVIFRRSMGVLLGRFDERW